MIKSLQQLEKMGTRKVLNKIYFEMISLSFLYKEYEFSGYAAEYARETIMHSGFDNFKMGTTDLQKCFVYINNLNNMNLTKKDEILLKRTSVDIQYYVRLLRKMATGSLPIGELNRFIKMITKNLYIEDNLLRALGRLSVNWTRLSLREKKVALDKLERYGIIHFRISKMTSYVTELSKSIKVEEREEKRQRRMDRDRERTDQQIGVDPDSQKTTYNKYSDKNEKPSLVNVGLAALGGYALHKFLSKDKPENNDKK